jgi:hypothetical protein
MGEEMVPYSFGTPHCSARLCWTQKGLRAEEAVQEEVVRARSLVWGLLVRQADSVSLVREEPAVPGDSEVPGDSAVREDPAVQHLDFVEVHQRVD